MLLYKLALEICQIICILSNQSIRCWFLKDSRIKKMELNSFYALQLGIVTIYHRRPIWKLEEISLTWMNYKVYIICGI